MLSLDPTTRAEYDAQYEADTRAQSVLDALADPVVVRVYDGNGQVMGHGTMGTPWAVRGDGTLTIGEVTSFAVLVSGSPDPASWYLRFESGSRWLRGTFGVYGSGADFTWRKPSANEAQAWIAGQVGALGAVATTAYDVPITFGWTFAQAEGEAYNLNVTVNPGGTVTIPSNLYAIPVGQTANWSLVGQADGTTITPTSQAGEPVVITLGSEVSPSDSYSVTVNLAEAVTTTGDLPTLTLTNGGANKPWTFGHAFKQGDVPAGYYLTATGPTQFQAEVRNRWSDGSVKFAVLSGIGGTQAQLVATQGTAPTGTVALDAGVTASVTFTGSTFDGTYTLASVQNTDKTTWGSKATGGRVRTIAGPVMTERHYYVPTTDAHVAVWFYVRSYSNGATEIETVVENGWMNVASPGEKFYRAVVTVNGTTRWPDDSMTSLAHIHHTRWSRADWVDAAYVPLSPVIDVDYWKASKIIPNYPTGTPEESYYSGIETTQNPAPFARGNIPSGMGSAGYSPHIGLMPEWSARYFVKADARSYGAIVGHARNSGRYTTHYRDETTGEPALATTVYRVAQYNLDGIYSNNSLTPAVPNATGTTTPPEWFFTHHPSLWNEAYLLTGRWSFAEEGEFHAGIIRMCWVVNAYDSARGLGWNIRTLAQAATFSPRETHRTAAATMLTEALTYQNNLYVLGAANNPWGVIQTTIGDQYQDAPMDPGNQVKDYAPWMIGFCAISMGWARQVEALSGASLTILESVSNFAHGLYVNLCGTNAGWNYRRMGVYAIPLGYPYTAAAAPATWYTPAQGYQLYTTNAGWTVLDDAEGNNLEYGTTPTDFVINSGFLGIGALAYAKDQGVNGAAAAWQRVASAPNFQGAASMFINRPGNSSIKPRT